MEVYGVYARGRRDPLVLSSIPLKELSTLQLVHPRMEKQQNMRWSGSSSRSGGGGAREQTRPYQTSKLNRRVCNYTMLYRKCTEVHWNLMLGKMDGEYRTCWGEEKKAGFGGETWDIPLWIHLAQERCTWRWRALVNTVINLRVP